MDLKNNSALTSWLIQEYREANEKIRHIESLHYQYLTFFSTVALSFFAFISYVFLWGFKHHNDYNYQNYSFFSVLPEMFYVQNDMMFLIVFSGFFVFSVSFFTLLIMTKAGRTKHKAQNKKKEIANIFNDDLAQEEKQEDWASRYILSTRRISKWLPFLYMSISWILTYGLVCIQARSIKDSDFILNVELFFLFIEFMAIAFYVYHHVCVWDTDIRRAMQKLSEKAKG